MLFQRRNIFCLLLLSLVFISCHNSDNLFESLSSSKTHIDFANNLEKQEISSGFCIIYIITMVEV